MAEPFANHMGQAGTANGLVLWLAADEGLALTPSSRWIGASSISRTSANRRSLRMTDRHCWTHSSVSANG